MNIKKYLQQLADKDAENLITESDRLFYKQLAEQCEENERKRKRNSKKRKVSKIN